ncbi:hypothetical protein KKF61_02285 [Patescibacteria group bacterium]|nr:hypothetical protein [Patescibacteria group bacterium]MBU0963855.1 hypothetical protein [Patescibacteria group bacterium]
MFKIRPFELLNIIAIVIIGAGSIGFFWHYSSEVQPILPRTQIVYRQPAVLGVYAELNQEEQAGINEYSLAQEPFKTTSKLKASDINIMFNGYCLRQPSRLEVDTWTNQNTNILQAAFLEGSIENCQ